MTFEFETPRLTLRPYRAEDLDGAAALYGDPIVNEYTKLGQLDHERSKAILDGHIADWRANGFGMHALFLKPKGAYVGESGFFVLASSGAVALRFALFPDYWGKGLIVEALKTQLSWGFGQAGLDRIVSVAHAQNRGSHRIMEKLGMRLDRPGRHGTVDILIYALERDEWIRGPSTDTRSETA